MSDDTPTTTGPLPTEENVVGDDAVGAKRPRSDAAADSPPTPSTAPPEGPHHSEAGVVGRGGHARSDDSSDDDSDAPPGSRSANSSDDPYDLRRRFAEPQRRDWATAFAEIKAGRKCSCWSWYVFPTAPWIVRGREEGSGTNRRYALRDIPPKSPLGGDDAARAFLRFPRAAASGVDLRANYVAIVREATRQIAERRVPPRELLGFLDEPKYRSSVRLFERVSRDGFDAEVNAVCVAALAALGETPQGAEASAVAASASAAPRSVPDADSTNPAPGQE